MKNKVNTKISQGPPPPPLSEGPKHGGGWFSRIWPSLLIVVGAIVVVIGLWMFLPERNHNTPPAELQPVAVRVMEVQALEEVEDSFLILGSVEPDCIIDVAAEVPGRVRAYAGRKDQVVDRMKIKKGPASAGMIKEGDPIKAGTPIIYINTDLLQAAFDQIKADCDFAEREAKRLDELFAKNVATKSEMDSVRRQRDVARAKLETFRANLERSIIVAPRDGILNSLPVDIGEYVTPGTVVAQIVERDIVKVILDIPERDIAYMKVGQEQDIFFTRDELKKITGEITYISELADQDTHTTRMEINVNNRNRRLRSGQMVYAKLKRRTLKDVIMVPLKTIVPLEKGYVAYVNNKGHAQLREIKLDLSMFHGDQIRVLEGLKHGDRLIIEPNIGPGQAIIEVGDAGLPSPASPSFPVAGRK